MTGHHSTGIGSKYVVMRSDTQQVVSDVLLLFPMEDRDAVGVAREAGLTEWADKLEAYWKGIDLMDRAGAT